MLSIDINNCNDTYDNNADEELNDGDECDCCLCFAYVDVISIGY